MTTALHRKVQYQGKSWTVGEKGPWMDPQGSAPGIFHIGEVSKACTPLDTLGPQIDATDRSGRPDNFTVSRR